MRPTLERPQFALGGEKRSQDSDKPVLNTSARSLTRPASRENLQREREEARAVGTKPKAPRPAPTRPVSSVREGKATWTSPKASLLP